ncbi:MAG: TPR end-of-group domain-containing protein [Gloeotrichia echinulata DVL01]
MVYGILATLKRNAPKVCKFYTSGVFFTELSAPSKPLNSINLNPEKSRERAKTDTDFDSIRDDERFQALIQE